MPVSGLILRLESGDAGDAVAAALAEWPELTLGERNGDWLPAALDARDADSSRHLHERLRSVRGVALVEVVYVNFDADPVQEEQPNPNPADPSLPPFEPQLRR